MDGNPVPEYSNFEGKPLLILFFYLGCPGCIGRAIPFANRMVYEHGDKINVIGIHSNFEGPEYTNEEIKEMMESLYVRFPYYRDFSFGATFYKYEAAGTPHWLFINKDGELKRSIFGSDPNRALLWLDYIISEELEEINQ